MIVLLGDSCAGKSSIEAELADRGYNKIISYTTRPKRDYEIDHKDYHFIDLDTFEQMWKDNRFAEHTNYNGWFYAIAKEDCIDDAIAVVEPNGFRQLKRNKNLNITSFYIKVPERERVVRMMERGDNVMESFRRIISDQGSFNGIENEVDHIISNPRGLDNLIDAVEDIDFIIKEEVEWAN